MEKTRRRERSLVMRETDTIKKDRIVIAGR